MSKIALIGDTHFGIRNDSPIFHEYFKRSLKYFFDYIDDNKIQHIIHLGDLFDRRKFLSYLTASVCRKEFLDPIQERKLDTHIIAGNHDQYFKDTYEVNALDEIVTNRYSYIKTYNTPQQINIDGLDIQLIPWINSKNHIQSFDRIQNTQAQVLIGHLELNGFDMFRGMMSEHGLETHLFDRFDLVFSGHYHHKSSKNNIHYIGAFAEYTWADYQDPRGFTILDTQTRIFEFIQNPHSIFQMIYYDDTKPIKIDYSKMKDTYVKVVCKNKTDQVKFDDFIENLYDAKPVDISIIEDSSLIETSESEDVVDEAQDTSMILSTYIKGLTLPVNNDRMITFMNDIYKEALSTEHLT